MTQTLAIFMDSYRELNAKKLFWITMILSAVVVAAFGFVGINDKGMTVLWWEIPGPFSTRIFTPATFYKLMFMNLGIGFWLGWLATILALVSTASMIPDFLAGGAIELTLSKPIGRVRLFITKYLAALAFVTLQVAVFSLGCFLVIGLRGKAWEPGLFLAVPLVVLFFSYLYCVCALLGLITRSTIAALLLTLGFWFIVFGLTSTEAIFGAIRLGHVMDLEAGVKQVEKDRAEVAALQAHPGESATKSPAPEKPTEGGIGAVAKWALEKAAADAPDADAQALEAAQRRLAADEERLEKVRASEASMSKWHRIFWTTRAVLPKATETKDLIERTLIDNAALEKMFSAEESPRSNNGPMTSPEFNIDEREFARRLTQVTRETSAWWIIGTSLGFEAVVLAIAALIFRRRDF